MILPLLASLLQTPAVAADPRPNLANLIATADVVLVGEVQCERRLPRRAAADVDAIQVRVATAIYGAGVEDVVQVVPRLGAPLAVGARVLLLLDDDPGWTPDFPKSPSRLYRVLENGRLPLRADGTADLSGFELPDALAPRADVALKALLPWVERVLDATAPRLMIREHTTGPAPRTFRVEPDGSWTSSGGYDATKDHAATASRAGRLTPEGSAAVLAAADPERFFAQPRLAGRSRAPDDRAVTLELRTRRGVHAIRLGPVREDPAEAAAAELCARVVATLPSGPGAWAVP